MSLVVVGSVAYDGIETPHGRVDRILGGACTYIALSASYFTKVSIVAVVGDDFAKEDEQLLAGRSIDLVDQQITMGRANDATLVLNDDYASTHHARIFPQDGQWIVEDLGSTNGTYLDRQKVTRPTPVPVGVPIRIGKTVLELRR